MFVDEAKNPSWLLVVRHDLRPTMTQGEQRVIVSLGGSACLVPHSQYRPSVFHSFHHWLYLYLQRLDLFRLLAQQRVGRLSAAWHTLEKAHAASAAVRFGKGARDVPQQPCSAWL